MSVPSMRRTMPPAVSSGLLARLQGLPGGDPGAPGGGGGLFDDSAFSGSVFGHDRDGRPGSDLRPPGEPGNLGRDGTNLDI